MADNTVGHQSWKCRGTTVMLNGRLVVTIIVLADGSNTTELLSMLEVEASSVELYSGQALFREIEFFMISSGL